MVTTELNRKSQTQVVGIEERAEMVIDEGILFCRHCCDKLKFHRSSFPRSILVTSSRGCR